MKLSHSEHSIKNSSCTLIFVVRHSDLLEVGTKIEIHNNGLLSEGEI